MQGSYQSLTDAVLPPDGWGDAVVDRHDDSARSVLHTDSIERWLHSRWVSGQPCVWLRPDVLVSVNPGRPLPGLHGDRVITTRLHEVAVRRGKSSRAERPAHPFAISEAAARRAAAGEEACICIVGESGSGKTEASKLVLLHLLNMPTDIASTFADADPVAAEAGASAHRALGLAVVLSRAVIEAFTHAAAPANANSSRLVLATQLWLSPHAGLLVAARYQLAMLQGMLAGLSPASGSTNFHALHAAAASASANELGGLEPSRLRLLQAPRGGAAHGRARGASFEELSSALAALGMVPAAIQRLRDILLGLLLLSLTLTLALALALAPAPTLSPTLNPLQVCCCWARSSRASCTEQEERKVRSRRLRRRRVG